MQEIFNNLTCSKCGGNVITAFDEDNHRYEIRCFNPECNHVSVLYIEDFTNLYE